MAQGDHIVYVVDDDGAIREAVDELLSCCGFSVVTFASAADYLEAAKPDAPACLILDVQLPDISGLDLQTRLAGKDHPPIVFITGHGDVPSSVRAMKAGALDFLPKPFAKDDIVAAVDAALAHHRKARDAAAVRERLCGRYDSLTPREREVLPLIVSGLLNKQAAARLGISIVTLQIHRGSIMRKMAARSLAELVRMAIVLDVSIVAQGTSSTVAARKERAEWPGAPSLRAREPQAAPNRLSP
jgi:FixJ family two-component response regulator